MRQGQRVVSHSSLPPNHIKASTLRLRQTVTLSGLYRPWFSRPVAGGPRIARRGSQKTKTKTGSEPGRSSSSRGKPDRTTNAGRGKPVRGARADKGHEQDMRQERALNRIARNEDVTEWRRDSICSLSLDKRYRCRCLMPRSRGRDAIPYPVSQINSDRMKDGAVRPINTARADSCTVYSLVAAGRSVLNHGSNNLTPAITSYGAHSSPLLCARRSCFSHVHNLKRALEAVTCLERATQAT